MFDSKLPSSSPQVVFEKIILNKDNNHNIPVGGKRVRVNWSDKEDNLLITAWLNVSKNSIVGNDSFWRRVWNYYDENRKDYGRRKSKHLKDHWHRLSPAVFKFARCYEKIEQQWQAGCSEKAIIDAAHELYRDNYGSRFSWEHAWKLLKDEPKWRAETHEASSKRTKISESGAYTPSSNPETPTSCEFDVSSPPSVCPMGKKAAKRNVVAKLIETSSANVEAKSEKMQEIAAKVVEISSVNVEVQSEKMQDIEERRLEASNPETPTSCEFDGSSPPLVCPMGQKVAERNVEAKVIEVSSANVEAQSEKMVHEIKAKVVELPSANVEAQSEKMQEIEERRLAALEQLALAKEEVARAKLELAQAKEEAARAKLLRVEYEILSKGSSGMSESQRKDHEMISEFIRKKFKTM